MVLQDIFCIYTLLDHKGALNPVFKCNSKLQGDPGTTSMNNFNNHTSAPLLGQVDDSNQGRTLPDSCCGSQSLCRNHREQSQKSNCFRVPVRWGFKGHTLIEDAVVGWCWAVTTCTIHTYSGQLFRSTVGGDEKERIKPLQTTFKCHHWFIHQTGCYFLCSYLAASSD